MRKLGVEELIRAVQAMYTNAKSNVRVNGQFGLRFDINVGVHQGSVLRPILFIIVMEALSREFRTSCPLELLYTDNRLIIAGTQEELLEKFSRWKTNIGSKGL